MKAYKLRYVYNIYRSDDTSDTNLESFVVVEAESPELAVKEAESRLDTHFRFGGGSRFEELVRVIPRAEETFEDLGEYMEKYPHSNYLRIQADGTLIDPYKKNYESEEEPVTSEDHYYNYAESADDLLQDASRVNLKESNSSRVSGIMDRL